MFEQNQEFAHFRIIRQIGSGGMGAVFLAEDMKLHRKVALKVLHAEYFDSEERLQRFHREAKTAAQISHPNVMGIHDIGRAPHPTTGKDINYIVMEYIEGQSLSEYIQVHGVDIGGVVRLAEKLASGFSAAHKLGIVHRDIKAENVIINADGEPKILDFGLAKPLDPVQFSGSGENTESISQELTKAGKIVGTVSYMSPEQVSGKPVDNRSDIFSFGILLYRMASGDLPFRGESQVSTLAKILETPHEPLRAKNALIPSELERIIDKCLQKNPEDRYQDTRDLVVDLRNLRRMYDSGSTESVTATVTTEAQRRPRRAGRLVLGGIGLAAIIALIALAVLNLGGGSPTTTVQAAGNSLAIIGFENKTGDSELDWLRTGLPEIMLTDLAQSQSLNLISRQRLLDYFKGDVDGLGYDDYLKASRALGAVHILSGSYYRLGDRIRIDARLEEVATGKIVMGEKVMGEDPFTLIDSLTEKIALSLNIAGDMAGHQGVASFASSPEAYRHYHKGVELFLDELFDQAIDEFNQAIAIDSSFALPYLRIGMANIFDGRTQIGQQYIAEAKRREGSLPIRERTLLDIYADIWMNRDFDRAFTKMESFVKNYPDDKEGRTIFALLDYVFSRDTTRAFAQFDTVLTQDPTFQLALGQFAQICAGLDMYDRAIGFQERLKRHNPDSPSPYLAIARYYRKMGRTDEAIAAYEELVKRFPDESSSHMGLRGLYILKRDFAQARRSLEGYRDAVGDDAHRLYRYFDGLAGLDVWQGKFHVAMDNLYQALDEAHKTGDSAYVRDAYATIAQYHERFEDIDSALYYAELMDQWSNDMQRINFPVQLVIWRPNLADSVRPMFTKASQVFKSRVPSDMWPLLDQLERIFEAYASQDSAAIIAETEKISEMQDGNQASDVYQIGFLSVLTGDYARGKETLLRLTEGDLLTANAFFYLRGLYYIGRANEGLGLRDEAIENYRELLKYWADADVQITEIRDARKRLAQLTS